MPAAEQRFHENDTANDVVVAMIVAMAENRVIGRNNQLPWRLPADLKYFKAVTMGKPIIMGRKTFESIGKPLPGRTNIVVTSNREWRAEGVKVARDPEQAVALASQIALADGVREIMIIGGARLYAELLSRARRLYLTEVKAVVDGDAYFPALNLSRWREREREDHSAGEGNDHGYSFVVLQREG